MIKQIYFFISIFFVPSVFAVSFSYQNDVADEIMTADFIQIGSDEKAKIIEILRNKSTDLPTVRNIVNEALKEKSYQDPFLNPRNISTAKNGKSVADSYLQITGPGFDLDSKHAIHNLNGYIENRIGAKLLASLQLKKVKTLVIGGRHENIEQDLKNILSHGQYEVTNLPSLYEKWGLYRYWIEPKKSKEKIFLMVVPPSIQYVRHYLSLLASAGNDEYAKGYLSYESRDELKRNLDATAKKVKNKYGNIDVLFFGYEKNWLENLNKQNRVWNIQSINSVTTEFDLNLQIIEIKHNKTNQVMKLGSLQPQQTVWGELASFYFESLLELKPKFVFFMGSAGSLKKELKPYQVSIPEQFISHGGIVKIQNWLLSDELSTTNSKIYQTARHGITYSPIQQEKGYVLSLVNTKIETVDVEQVLVAKMVQKHNTTYGTDIKFGAINVITDQPGGVLWPRLDAGHNLDILDTSSKSKAKNKATEIAIQALDIWVNSQSSVITCHSLMK